MNTLTTEKPAESQLFRSLPRAFAPTPRGHRQVGSRTCQAIEDSARLLECFTGSFQDASISGLSGLLGVTERRTRGYLKMLVVSGWLEQHPADGRYRLRARSIAPGLAVLSGIAKQTGSWPVLSGLRARLGFTTSLVILDGLRAVYVQRARAHGAGQERADMGLRGGAQVPLHCTAAGKALLSTFPAGHARRIVTHLTLDNHGPATIKDRELLIRQVKLVAQRGIASSDDEFARGIRSIAVPISPTPTGLALALEASIPAGHGTTSEIARVIVPDLSAAAQQMSIRLCPPSVEPIFAHPAKRRPRRKRPSRAESEARAEKMAELRNEEKLTLAAIGREYKVSRQCVHQILKAREETPKGRG
jgi:DNA-binding IclR family transcriptional regulator